METIPYLLHALSPLHAGTGQSVSVIDLPIARLRSTGIPIVPGSSVKGVLREARRRRLDTDHEWREIFGPEDDPSRHAGALVVGDARLFALPVRSFRGTFAWVSSPLLLELARRDLGSCPGAPVGVPDLTATGARIASLEARTVHTLRGGREVKRILLEDLDLAVASDETVAAWAGFLAPSVEGGEGALAFSERFVVVDDETMTFLWETATQIDARVRLDERTRTVADGALWIEESLPPESLLVGLLAAESGRGAIGLSPLQVLGRALPEAETLQFGGKATVGRGRCRITPLGSPVEAQR